MFINLSSSLPLQSRIIYRAIDKSFLLPRKIRLTILLSTVLHSLKVENREMLSWNIAVKKSCSINAMRTQGRDHWILDGSVTSFKKLLWNYCRFVENLQTLYMAFIDTLHPASPNVNSLHSQLQILQSGN